MGCRKQRDLQAEIARNTVHWPMTLVAWNPPVALPVTPTPSKSTASVTGRLPSMSGSPTLETLPSAAAQVERQTTKTAAWSG